MMGHLEDTTLAEFYISVVVGEIDLRPIQPRKLCKLTSLIQSQ